MQKHSEEKTKETLEKELFDTKNRCEGLEIALEETRNMLEVIKHNQEDIEMSHTMLSGGKYSVMSDNLRTLETLIHVTTDRVIKGLKENKQ